MIYKAVGRSIINYDAPVWSTNQCDTNYRNIQYTQNEALRIATGCHKMSSVNHIHVEAKILKVREHSELLSAQYLARCLEPGNACHSITTRETPKRRTKETLFTRHCNTVEPMMLVNRNATLQAIHSDAVNKAVNDQKKNSVRWSSTPNQLLRKKTNQEGTCHPRTIKIRYCKLLGSYKSRIKKDASLDCLCRLRQDATRRQASLRLPGSSDDIDSVRPVEQTRIQLSRGGKPRLRQTKT